MIKMLINILEEKIPKLSIVTLIHSDQVYKVVKV